MSLVSAYHPVYATIIHDLIGSYYSRKTALTLLNEACILKGGADYSGKLRAIRQTLSYLKKTPLIISIAEKIYGFPTMSPNHFDCMWIFPRHIVGLICEKGMYYVLFKNGLKIPINCSAESFRTQQERSSHSFLHCENLLTIETNLNVLT